MLIINYLTKIPVLKRFVPSVIRRVCKVLKIEFFTIKYEQVYFRLKITDAVDRHILFRGEYENLQIEYLFESFHKHKIKTFIDIGSNIGVYSILLEKNAPDIKIFAFEPHPDAFLRLEYNLKLNNSKNISPHNVALSDKNKKGFLSIGENHKKNFKNFQSGGAQVNESGNIPISLAKGDDILDYNNEFFGIKIDVEGHEKFVIYGMKNLLINNKAFIQIEVHSKNFYEVDQILNDLGYNQIKKIGSHDYYYSNF